MRDDVGGGRSPLSEAAAQPAQSLGLIARLRMYSARHCRCCRGVSVLALTQCDPCSLTVTSVDCELLLQSILQGFCLFVFDELEYFFCEFSLFCFFLSIFLTTGFHWDLDLWIGRMDLYGCWKWRRWIG